MMIEFGSEVVLPLDPDKAITLGNDSYIDRATDGLGTRRHALLERVQVDE